MPGATPASAPAPAPKEEDDLAKKVAEAMKKNNASGAGGTPSSTNNQMGGMNSMGMNSMGGGMGGMGMYGGGMGMMGGGMGMMGGGMGMMGGGMEDDGMTQYMEPLMKMGMVVQLASQAMMMLGGNIDQLGFFLSQLLDFINNTGFACVDFYYSLAPHQKFSREHPRYGEPPPTKEQEQERLRKIKMVKLLGGVAAMLVGWRYYKRWQERRHPKLPSRSEMLALEQKMIEGLNGGGAAGMGGGGMMGGGMGGMMGGMGGMGRGMMGGMY
jgi:hypothetical protein